MIVENIQIGVPKPGFNVMAIVRDKDGKIKSVNHAKNIVGDAGDIFYAQMGAEEAPDNLFAECQLGTDATAATKGDNWGDLTKIASSEKAPTGGWPKSNDQEADNSGKAVDSVTYKYEWTGGDFNDNAIREGIICVTGASGTDPILTRWVWGAAFEKTATDTLTLYVNHNMLGV
jgi:hypothetical protein